MGEMGGKISNSLLGGYNKKSVDAYIEELQAEIENLRKDLEIARTMNMEHEEKLQEAEDCYKTLWERSQEQEKIIGQQKNEIKTNKNVIDVQKETIRSRGEVIRRQEDVLRKEKESILGLQEDFEKLGEELGRKNEQVSELEVQLEQKDQMILEKEEIVAKLEDKVEKQQWLYEEFFKNKGRVPVSKLEQYVRESMRKRIKRRN